MKYFVIFTTLLLVSCSKVEQVREVPVEPKEKVRTHSDLDDLQVRNKYYKYSRYFETVTGEENVFQDAVVLLENECLKEHASNLEEGVTGKTTDKLVSEANEAQEKSLEFKASLADLIYELQGLQKEMIYRGL